MSPPPVSLGQPVAPLFAAPASAPILAGPLTESSWYVRADYYHWNERLGGGDFVNEDGLLTTLGYVHRRGPERFRFELFGGSIHYDGEAMFDGGGTEPLTSTTDILGVRGEYDFLIEPEILPRLSFFLGIGTRIWVRDLQDGFLVDHPDPRARLSGDVVDDLPLFGARDKTDARGRR